MPGDELREIAGGAKKAAAATVCETTIVLELVGSDSLDPSLAPIDVESDEFEVFASWAPNDDIAGADTGELESCDDSPDHILSGSGLFAAERIDQNPNPIAWAGEASPRRLGGFFTGKSHHEGAHHLIGLGRFDGIGGIGVDRRVMDLDNAARRSNGLELPFLCGKTAHIPNIRQEGDLLSCQFGGCGLGLGGKCPNSESCTQSRLKEMAT